MERESFVLAPEEIEGLSKIQEMIVRQMARTPDEASLYARIAREHNQLSEEGQPTPFSKTRDWREAFVGILLRQAHDTPYLMVLGPIVAIVCYALVLLKLFGIGI